MQAVEPRRLFSSVDLSNGVLSFAGTADAPNQFSATFNADSTLTVTANGQTQRLASTAVRKIVVTGGAENDVVAVDTRMKIPVTFDLGSGDDMAVTGGGDDWVSTGTGADQVWSGGGADVIYYDAGDTLLDRASRDTYVLTVFPVELPSLRPGKGFDGPTAQPGAIRPQATFGDAKAIARWDVVPYQTFDGRLNVGVVAFHSAEIDRVEFSVDGGKWVGVSTMTANPQTGVTEYWAALDASAFGDGAVEVRAIAYPKAGVPRVLDGLTLYANAHGTLAGRTVYVSTDGNDAADGAQATPVKTIHRALRLVRQNGSADGGRVVLLKEGFYELPTYASGHDADGATATANDRWLTIASAPGLNRDAVIVGRPAGGSVARMRVTRLKFERVSVDFTTTNQFYVGPQDGLWFDDTRWFSTNNGDTQNNFPVRSTSDSYVTNSVGENLKYGFVGLTAARDVKLINVRGDAFASTRLVLNAQISGVRGTGGKDFHSDLFQYSGAFDNVIVYGVKASDLASVQCFFLEPTIYSQLGKPQVTLTDVAFVDMDMQYVGDPASPPYSQLLSRFDNVLFRNVRLPRQRLILRTDVRTNNQAWYAHNLVFDRDNFFVPIANNPAGGVHVR